jgi:CO dehydrogenase/acetyl-CoA synthase gamma subunit (corrinoid Fe-S protein)
MAEQSKVSEQLWLLEGIADFSEHNLAVIKQGRRNIAILTRDLDAPVYGSNEFVQALSDFARSSRNANVQILVKDTKTAIETGHPLVRLAQRLSSKIMIRKMTVEPNNKEMGFLLCDTNKLVYKNDERVYRGFANYAAAREIKPLSEEFNYLWQYGEAELEFQILHI